MTTTLTTAAAELAAARDVRNALIERASAHVLAPLVAHECRMDARLARLLTAEMAA